MRGFREKAYNLFAGTFSVLPRGTCVLKFGENLKHFLVVKISNPICEKHIKKKIFSKKKTSNSNAFKPEKA